MSEAPTSTIHHHYTLELEDRVSTWAQAKIEPKRITHVRWVVETAEQLAERYAPDEIPRARLAGWIHDVAKHWREDELLEFATAHKLAISDVERRAPSLLHGAVGYALANDVFLLDDEALRTACAYHTTGAPDMAMLDKVVFMADMIEPGRDFPGVDAIRADAEQDLDTAMLRAIDFTIEHVLEKQKLVEPRAILLHNQLINAGVRYLR